MPTEPRAVDAPVDERLVAVVDDALRAAWKDGTPGGAGPARRIAEAVWEWLKEGDVPGYEYWNGSEWQDGEVRITP